MASKWSSSVQEADQKIQTLSSELSSLPPLPTDETQGDSLGFHSEYSTKQDEPKDLIVDLGSVQNIDCVVLVPAQIPGVYGNPDAYGFPKRFSVDVSDHETFEHVTGFVDYSKRDFLEPGRFPIALKGTPVSGRYVRLRAHKLAGQPGQYFFALGEMFMFGPGHRMGSGIPRAAEFYGTDSFGSGAAWLRINAFDGQSSLGAATSLEKSPTFGWHTESFKHPDATAWLTIDLGRIVTIEEIRLHPATPQDGPRGAGYAFPQSFTLEGASEENFSQPFIFKNRGQFNQPNPGTNPLCFRGQKWAARYLRLNIAQLERVKSRYETALSEIEVFEGDKNVALGLPVNVSSSNETSLWNTKALTDGFSSIGRLIETQDWLVSLSRRRELEAALRETTALRDAARDSFGIWLDRVCWALASSITLILLASWLRTRRARSRDLNSLRQRIARDLHDEIGSNLGTIAMLSQMALEHQASETQIRNDVTEIGVVANHSVDAIRDLVWLLEKESMDQADLIGEMKITAQHLLRGIACDFEINEAQLPSKFPFELRRNLFLAFKEILHNAAKHSEATHVRVVLAVVPPQIVLTISDNGRGFDPSLATSGIGLSSLKTRAAQAGGSVHFISHPERGTTIQFTLPLSPNR